jgi:hypothetical protein
MVSPLYVPPVQRGCSRQADIYIGELAAITIAICICYLFGLRWLWLLFASLIMWFPVYLACMFVFTRIVPPQFELYDPYPSSSFKDPEFVTLFPRENVEGEKPKKTNRTGDEPPKDS